MYFAIYNDDINKITRYYYTKDGNIYFDEYSNKGVKKYQTNSLYDIYKLFCFNDSNKFVENNGEYDIYIDKNNNKHYLKDGKEDYLQFFLNNGKSCIVFDEEVDENEEEEEEELTLLDVIKGLVKGISVGVGISVICSSSIMSNLGYPTVIDKAENFLISEVPANLECDDIFDLINNKTNIPEEYKNSIINSGIIEKLMQYYDNRDLNILHYKKLNNLSIQYGTDEHINNSGASAYYNPAMPNIIHIKDDDEHVEDCFYHELIHLFQTNYIYLSDSMAELMSYEYFGQPLDSYQGDVNVLKLLIATVGAEPILKGDFGGDYSDLEEIIKNNLDEEDAKEMLKMLSANSDTDVDILTMLNVHAERNDKLIDYVQKMYKNINGIEMKQSLSGFLILNSESLMINDITENGFYLKDNGTISFTIDSVIYDSLVKDMDIVNTEDINYYQKEITEESYNIIKNQGEIPGLTLSIDENDGLTKYIAIAEEGKIGIDEEWSLHHQGKKVTASMSKRNLNKSFNTNQSVENYVDQLIAGMENGTLDTNGNPISNTNEEMNVRKGGYSDIPLLTIMSLLTALGILLIGIIYFIIV